MSRVCVEMLGRGRTVCRQRVAPTILVALCVVAVSSAQNLQPEKEVGDACRTADGFWGTCALSRNCGSFVLNPALSTRDVCAASGRRLLVCCGAVGRPPHPARPHGGSAATDVSEQVLATRGTTTSMRRPGATSNDPWWLSEGTFDGEVSLPSQPLREPPKPWWADLDDMPFSGGQPSMSFDGDQAARPNRPFDGDQAARPNRPFDGDQAARPNRPFDNGQTVRPNRPFDNGQTVRPNRPFDNGQTVRPNRPFDNGQTVRPNRPFDNGQTVRPNRPFDNGQTVRPNRPFDNGQTVRPNRPFDNGQTARPNRPLDNGQTVRPNRPLDNGQTVRPNRPLDNGQTVRPNRPFDGGQTARPNRPFEGYQNGPGGPYDGEPDDDGELIAFPGPTSRPQATSEQTLYINPPFRPSTDPPRRQSERRISEIKCDEYSQQVRSNVSALPLVPDPEPISVQVENCNYNSVRLIVGGEKTVPGEFPHMAALGYRDGRNLAWNCGGTLISDYYVLTAAHCTYTGSGPPAVVRLGEYNLRSNNDGAQPVDYSVSKVIRHPDYKPPAKYNDIGLLRLSRRVIFNKFIRPACLYTDDYLSVNKTTAIGWGRIDYAESASDVLLKVSLSIIDNSKCNQLYRSDIKTNTLSKGILPSMLCAGELKGGKDTCQGDSGGPIQISSRNNQCIHYIIGITSFGKFCAGKNAPGVYTRVSYFIPWIESVVWPSN